MFDIITFGSATLDIFVKPKEEKIIKDERFVTGKGVCFNLGSKVDIDKIDFFSGGGGTNTAATFVKQEFRVAFCGAVGDDLAGEEIIEELNERGIDTKFVLKKKEKPTNHSIVISSEGEDRTILVYRGASELLNSKEIPWKKLKTSWIYLAPFSGLLCLPVGRQATIFEDIVNFAFENKIKIAVNPGDCQLSLPMESLKRILSKVDVLILNQEEASFLTKIPFVKEAEIFKKIDEICSGVAIMTKGGEGVVVSDGKYLYRAKHSKIKVVDMTGAGDSFASGFISDYIRYNGDIEKAIQLGIANSAACLSERGAKNGLLNKNSKFERVSVAKEECGKNNLCQTK